MKFSIKDFFSKIDQIRWKMRIWSHLLKKSLMQNFVFCAVKNQSTLVAFDSFRLNVNYKCLRLVNSRGLSEVSTRMQNHITQAVT